MSNEFKKMSEEELLLSSGGKGGALASIGGGPVLTVRNAARSEERRVGKEC